MSNQDTLVSVVVPAYNAESTIDETLESLFSQTYTTLEVIVCDDASTDSTWEILQKWEDPRLVCIRNIENLGPGRSRDRAIARASGAWIAFVDADDVCRAERIGRLLHATEYAEDVVVFDNAVECHHTKTGLVPWRVMRKDAEFGVPAGQYQDIPIRSWLLSDRQLLHPMIPAVAIKGAKKVRHSDRLFVEDTEFLLAVLASGMRLRYLAEPFYYYRITPGSLSSLRNRWEGVAKIFRDAAADFSDQPDVQDALMQCAVRAERNCTYRLFVDFLRTRDYLRAAKLLRSRPALLGCFVIRLAQDLIYATSRLWKGGVPRR